MWFTLICAVVIVQASTHPDLAFMAGEWTGTLTYLDYQDDKTRREIKASMTATVTADGLRYRFSYVEPAGRVVGGDAVTVSLGSDGSTARIGSEEWRVTRVEPNGLTLERLGLDNGRPASLVRVISLRDGELRISTSVVILDGQPPLLRNTYALRRTR